MKNTIEFIGTGSGLNPLLGNTSFIVHGEEKKLLVDCGSTVPLELLKSGQLKEITDILITHNHSDHVGGLEVFGFYSYFALENTGSKRKNLHLPTESLLDEISQSVNAIKYGGPWNEPLINFHKDMLNGGYSFPQIRKEAEEKGIYSVRNLEDYFKINLDRSFNLEGIGKINFFPTIHAPFQETYGITLDHRVYYSGDTIEVHKPENYNLILHDCQFFEGGIHPFYKKLDKEIPAHIKKDTVLVHLGGGHEKVNPIKDGFKGFVMPGDKFEV